jgi:competence protein ComGC
MKSLTKSLIVATIVGAVGTGTVATGAIASAESGTATDTDSMSSLVDKIASTFNLDKAKVQEVFDEQRSEMETKREAEVEAKLQTLVDDGTITTEQKTAIKAKMAAMKAERESNKDNFKDMTEEERKAAIDKKKTELETWAKEQGIDLTKLNGVFGGPRGGHRP